MTPAETLLAWDDAIKNTESALKYLKELPGKRSRGSSPDTACVENGADIAYACLEKALELTNKLKNPPVNSQ